MSRRHEVGIPDRRALSTRGIIETLREPLLDWFQTETGAIMISNHPDLSIRPGSMGKPVYGIEPAILADDGAKLQDGEQGNLCIKVGWPSMFITYLNNESAFLSKIRVIITPKTRLGAIVMGITGSWGAVMMSRGIWR